MKKLALVILIAVAASAEQTTPPAPAPPREAKLPRAAETKLDNGLRVIVVPKHDIPLVAAELLIRTGAAADPAGKAGLAQITANVLTKGTKTRSAEQIAREVEALGATLESNAGWDSSAIDLSVMSTNLPKALQYAADVARNATFTEKEVELERAQEIDSIQVGLTQPSTVAALVTSRVLFGDEPYGHSANGTPQSLAKITPGDLSAFHAKYYRPGNAVLVLAGDVTPEKAFALAKDLFGTWPAGKAISRPVSAASQQGRARVVVVDMPDAGQASVVVARRGIRRADPAYFRAVVANSVLGNGYSSRLNQEIRIKRGLSYGAGSYFQARASTGPFIARVDTKNESAAEVASLIVAEMNGLAAGDVPSDELVPRKAALIGEFAQSLETTAGIVGQIADRALYDLPLTEMDRYVGSVQAVSAADVKTFSQSNLRGTGSHVIIAGNASAFLEELKKQQATVEVIPIADLDLNSPTLRVRKAKK